MPFFLSISLIIKHTAEVHEQVADLLRQLRRLQDLQVSVEVRFITVQRHVLRAHRCRLRLPDPVRHCRQTHDLRGSEPDHVAVPDSGSHDGNDHAARARRPAASTGTSGERHAPAAVHQRRHDRRRQQTGGGIERRQRPASVAAARQSSGGGATAGGSSGGSTSGVTQQPVYLVNPVRDHALGNNTPLIVGTQGGGLANFSPNLDLPYTGPTASLVQPSQFQSGAGGTFGIAFLSDLEVYLFLTAAQGDQRANVLQAPKVTTFNGAAATIFNNIVQYYIASLTPIVGPGAVAYSPTIGLIPSGVTLTVTPVVSADRRYVRLTLTPFFNALNNLQTFTFPGGAVGGSGLGGGATTISDDGSASQHDHDHDHDDRHRP